MPLHVTLDPILATLSVVLAIGTTYTALDLIGRLETSRHRSFWALACAVALGLGVWSSQFTGLQALGLSAPGVDLSANAYHVWRALAAMAASLVMALLVLVVLWRGRPSTRRRLVAATLLGIGITLVHQLALGALRAPIVLPNRPGVTIEAMVALVLVAAFALEFAAEVEVPARIRTLRVVIASVALGGAIAGLNLYHLATASYTSAPGVGPGPVVAITDLGGAAIAMSTLVILFFAAFASISEVLRRQQADLAVARMQSEQALAEAHHRQTELERLRELDKLKSQFLSAVSHELRTPLTAISGYAEFLEDGLGGPLSSTQSTYVSQIQTGARRLHELVDDLLVFAQMEAGSFEIHRQDVDLDALVADELSILAPQATSAGVRVEIQRSHVSARFPLDPQRIGQVLLNLVGNAIKFNRPGGWVSVDVEAVDGQVCVAVRDNGIGISAEHLPHLFEKFYQADASSTRAHGGVGLGLALSKAIVEAHGGTIWAESEPGHGSTFCFCLPVAASPTGVARRTPSN